MSFIPQTSESLFVSSPQEANEESLLSFGMLRRLADETNEDEDDDADEPNKVGTALSYIFLFFLIFGLSATVEIKNLKKQLQNKFAIATGVAMQFLIMPILGFLAVISLQSQDGWTQEMGVALLVVTSSPGGSYSNWWCSLFNADLALSVAMTTVSSLLSMAMLPLNLFLYTFLAYGRSEEESVVQALNFKTVFLALGIVLLAISSGLIAGYRNDTRAFHVMANRLGSLSGVLLVLFSIFISSGADGAENNFWNQDWSFYVGVAFPCLVGIALANIIARSLRLAHPETVAISIECCYQNTGIATSVAIAMYDDKEERAQAVAVPLFYGVVEAVAIAIYCVWAWKVGWTKAPRDEKLCVVLANTYEGLEQDEDAVAAAAATVDAEGGEVMNDESEATRTSRFQDDGLPLGMSTRSNIDEIDEIQEKALDGTATTVPFWRRMFGGGRQRTNVQQTKKETAPFRNDVALAAAMGTVPASSRVHDPASAEDEAAVKSSSSKTAKGPATLAATPHSPARHRSFTMETTASSSASSDRGPQTPVVRSEWTSPPPAMGATTPADLNLPENHPGEASLAPSTLPEYDEQPPTPQAHMVPRQPEEGLVATNSGSGSDSTNFFTPASTMDEQDEDA